MPGVLGEAGHTDLVDGIYGHWGEGLRNLGIRPLRKNLGGKTADLSGASHGQKMKQGRGKRAIGTQGQIYGGESYASFADEIFIEGTLDMRSIRKHSRGAARSAGRTILASLAAVLLAANSGAQSRQSVPDVTTLSMADLMNLQVTSVSKRTQKGADAAAAGFVITQEDIRR